MCAPGHHRMSKIRINELARELEVKPNVILDLLPELGVTDKKTHSSSLDDDVALKSAGVSLAKAAPAGNRARRVEASPLRKRAVPRSRASRDRAPEAVAKAEAARCRSPAPNLRVRNRREPKLRRKLPKSRSADRCDRHPLRPPLVDRAARCAARLADRPPSREALRFPPSPFRRPDQARFFPDRASRCRRRQRCFPKLRQRW